MTERPVPPVAPAGQTAGTFPPVGGPPPLPDPADVGDAGAGDFYAWLAGHARRAQEPAEREATARRARVWAASESAAVRARLAADAARSADADAARRAADEDRYAAALHALMEASPRRAVRLVREAPVRGYAPSGRAHGAARDGSRVAEACALKARAALGGLVPALELGAAAGDGRDLRDAPVLAWVPLPAELPDGRYLAMPVEGASMEPALYSGDLLLVQLGAAPVAGTVVVARHPDDGYVVKRLDRVTSRAYELAPVNPAFPRLAIPRDPALVLGRVALVWRALPHE